jgi:hypothetical protein
MKSLITIAVAVTALSLGSLTRATAPPPDQSERPVSVVAQSTPDAGSFKTLSADNHFSLLAFIDVLQAVLWKKEISAVLLAIFACAYLPKKYRSFGAFLRYLKTLSRDSLWRFQQRLRLFRFRCCLFFDRLIGRELAINSVTLNPRQQAIAANILSALGVSEQEDVVVNSPGHYAPGQVTEFDRSGFVNAPLATNAVSQFTGNNPHEYLSQYAVRYQDPNMARWTSSRICSRHRSCLTTRASSSMQSTVSSTRFSRSM